MTDTSAAQLNDVRTAVAVLCLLDGANAPVEELLKGLAPPEQLKAIVEPLRDGTRKQRAAALASYLSDLAAQLNAWSLK